MCRMEDCTAALTVDSDTWKRQQPQQRAQYALTARVSCMDIASVVIRLLPLAICFCRFVQLLACIQLCQDHSRGPQPHETTHRSQYWPVPAATLCGKATSWSKQTNTMLFRTSVQKGIRSSHTAQGCRYHPHQFQKHRLQIRNRSYKRLWQAAHALRHRSGAPSKRSTTLCYSVTAAGSAGSGRESGGGATTQVFCHS